MIFKTTYHGSIMNTYETPNETPPPDPTWPSYMAALRAQVATEVAATKAHNAIDHQASESGERCGHFIEPYEVHGIEFGQHGAYRTHKGRGFLREH